MRWLSVQTKTKKVQTFVLIMPTQPSKTSNVYQGKKLPSYRKKMQYDEKWQNDVTNRLNPSFTICNYNKVVDSNMLPQQLHHTDFYLQSGVQEST